MVASVAFAACFGLSVGLCLYGLGRCADIKREPLRFPSFFMILFLVLVCLFGGLLILPLFLEGGLSHGLALLKLAV